MKIAKLLPTLLAGALFALPAAATELKIGLQDDADMLDPAQSRTFVGRIVYTALCDKLVDLTPDLKIVPQLATEWSWSDDGKELTMKLREGVKFHDGTPFNADAVVYAVTRIDDPAGIARKSELTSVEKVEAAGEYEVKFTLKGPDATLLAQLSDRAGMMISPTAAKATGRRFRHQAGLLRPLQVRRAGAARPHRAGEVPGLLEQGQHLHRQGHLSADPRHDGAARQPALRRSRHDRAAGADRCGSGARRMPTLPMTSVVGLGYLGIYFNVGNGARADNPLGKDKRLRQAFSLAIDREAANQIVFEGTAVAGNQPFSPQSPWYDKDIPVPARDVDKAKALIKEAGFDRVPVELLVTNNPVVHADDADHPVDGGGSRFRRLAEGDGVRHAARRQDSRQLPGQPLRLVGPRRPGRQHPPVRDLQGRRSTTSKYCNPEVDKLLNEARQSPDDAVRKQKYDAAAAILNDDLPIIYLGHQSLDLGAEQEGHRLRRLSRRHDPACRREEGRLSRAGCRRGIRSPPGVALVQPS